MTRFLFEILSEEIPADLQKKGANFLHQSFEKYCAESGISIEYLAKLHQRYEGWLRDPNFKTPVITVFASDVTAIKPQELAEKIINFRTV